MQTHTAPQIHTGLSHDSAYLIRMGTGLHRSYTVTGLLIAYGSALISRSGCSRRSGCAQVR